MTEPLDEFLAPLVSPQYDRATARGAGSRSSRSYIRPGVVGLHVRERLLVPQHGDRGEERRGLHGLG
jgi:hypothetical protein